MRIVIIVGVAEFIMRPHLLFSLFGVVHWLAGCSAHPLQDDVTRKSTFAIVQKIRCEARTGILESRLPDKVLANTYIGFDFTFDITEKNKAASGVLGFTNPLSGGKFTLDLNGGVDKSRQAERFFRVIELMKDLRDDKSCLPNAAHANLVYPIAGNVGLNEVVVTYAALREIGLRKQEKGAVFSDTLTFVTTWNAGIKPTLEVNAGGGYLKLTKAAIDGSVERKDSHKVVVAIAGKADVKDVAKFTFFSSRRGGPPPGAGSDAAGVILELERLRTRDDDARTLETLRLLQ